MWSVSWVYKTKKKNFWRKRQDRHYGNRHAWTSSLILYTCPRYRESCSNSHLWCVCMFRAPSWAALHSGWSSWWSGPPLMWCPDPQYQLCATARNKKNKNHQMPLKSGIASYSICTGVFHFFSSVCTQNVFKYIFQQTRNQAALDDKQTRS